MSTEPHPRKHKAQIRQAQERLILEAAESVFAEHGYKGATTSKIAERAGVGKANLHYYFPTKDDLYRQVITDICDTWLETAYTFDEESDPAVAIRLYLESKMDLSRSRPMGSKVWANEIIHGAPFMMDYVQTTVKDWFEGRLAVVQKWIDDGKIDPIDPATLFYMIWGATQTFSDFETQIQVLHGNKPITDEEYDVMKETVVSVFLKGIGAV
ncbi:MAG: TetR family transcriptional regulator C-terminal domain-containing protein [Sphingomonadales bacterium]|nr:TetR family transcriptional regulator C-terminal domain-containing protein [Sphingomonadales bacterium]